MKKKIGVVLFVKLQKINLYNIKDKDENYLIIIKKYVIYFINIYIYV